MRKLRLDCADARQSVGSLTAVTGETQELQIPRVVLAAASTRKYVIDVARGDPLERRRRNATETHWAFTARTDFVALLVEAKLLGPL